MKFNYSGLFIIVSYIILKKIKFENYHFDFCFGDVHIIWVAVEIQKMNTCIQYRQKINFSICEDQYKTMNYHVTNMSHLLILLHIDYLWNILLLIVESDDFCCTVALAF